MEASKPRGRSLCWCLLACGVLLVVSGGFPIQVGPTSKTFSQPGPQLRSSGAMRPEQNVRIGVAMRLRGGMDQEDAWKLAKALHEELEATDIDSETEKTEKTENVVDRTSAHDPNRAQMELKEQLQGFEVGTEDSSVKRPGSDQKEAQIGGVARDGKRERSDNEPGPSPKRHATSNDQSTEVESIPSDAGSSFFEHLERVDNLEDNRTAADLGYDEGAVGDLQSMHGVTFIANEKERHNQATHDMFEAAVAGDLERVKKCEQKGANIHAHDPTMADWTALHYAADNGSLPLVKHLLRQGANISSCSTWGKTALHVACLEGHTMVVALLLNNGSNPDSPAGNSLYTPLHVAASAGHLRLVRLLYRYGADPHAETVDKCTPLNLASTQGHLHVVGALLQYGVDIDHQNFLECTSLHMAAMADQGEIVKYLMKHGANGNLTNWKGRTPVHEAACRGHIDTLEIMIDQYPLDLNITDKEGCNAFEACRKLGEGLCATVLWEKMGRPGGRLEIPQKPLNSTEEEAAFCKEMWDTFVAHRTEPHMGSVNASADIHEWIQEKKRINGFGDGKPKEEDNWVIRKGVRVYIQDKPQLARQKAIKDKWW